MRTLVLTTFILILAANPAWAIGGHGSGGNGGGNTKYATLNAVNNADGAVDVSVNGSYWATLEPLETRALAFYINKGNKFDVTLTASLTASPSITTTKSASIQGGKTATATISSPSSSTLAIAFSGQGVVGNLGRESGVMLASTGGLLPLLWLSFVLGRTPRRREDHPDNNRASA